MRHLLLPILFVSLLGGCAAVPNGVAPSSPVGYNTAQAQHPESVNFGTIVGLRPVGIAPQTTYAGTVGGGILGNVLGSGIGRGRGRTTARVLGTILGAAVGSAVENQALTQQGEQVIVRLDTGGTYAITQAVVNPLSVGERVEVIGLYGQGQLARVLPVTP